MLLGMTQAKIRVEQDSARMRPSDVPVLLGDASRFRDRTGWTPTIPFEQTMRDLLDYWRSRWPLRTLVTGVAGFVGRHLVRALTVEGAGGHGADHHPLDAIPEPEELRSSLRSYRALDVTDAGAVSTAVQELRPAASSTWRRRPRARSRSRSRPRPGR